MLQGTEGPDGKWQTYDMRSTVELPGHLLTQVKLRATANGISLRQFFIQAVESRLAGGPVKARLVPPCLYWWP